MRKFLILTLCILFLGVTAQAGIVDKLKSVIARKNARHDCSGDLKFGWSAESLTIASGSPAGCTDGSSTTMTANSAAALVESPKSDGTYGGDAPTGEDYFSPNSPSTAEFEDGEGKIIIDVYIDTWADSAGFVWIYGNPDNNLNLYLGDSSTDIRFFVAHEHNTTIAYLATPDSHGFGEDQWYRVEYRWKANEDLNDHWIQVCELTPPDTTSNCTTVVQEDDDLTDWGTTVTAMSFGQWNANGADFTVDNIRIYATSGY